MRNYHSRLSRTLSTALLTASAFLSGCWVIPEAAFYQAPKKNDSNLPTKIPYIAESPTKTVQKQINNQDENLPTRIPYISENVPRTQTTKTKNPDESPPELTPTLSKLEIKAATNPQTNPTETPKSNRYAPTKIEEYRVRFK